MQDFVLRKIRKQDTSGAISLVSGYQVGVNFINMLIKFLLVFYDFLLTFQFAFVIMRKIVVKSYL